MSRAWILAIVIACAPGCVVVYHPMTGLQQPALVDHNLANFPGLRLDILCIPGEYLDADDMQTLCRHMQTLFTNQGAVVRTGAGAAAETAGDDDTPAELVVEIKARQVHSASNGLLWSLSFISFTLVPASSEVTFVQDVSVRDASGFLLASRSLHGRFIEHFGVGYWGINWLLNRLVRDDAEEQNEEMAKADFSRDFYRHMSQLLYSAHARHKVLQEAVQAAKGRS